MKTIWEIGEPVAVKMKGLVYGRVTGHMGEETFAPQRPQLEIHTPHGSRIITGIVFAQEVDEEGLKKLIEYEEDAKNNPDALWYGGKLKDH